MSPQTILENNWAQVHELGKSKSCNGAFLQMDIRKRSLGQIKRLMY